MRLAAVGTGAVKTWLSAVPPVLLGRRWRAARETLCQQVLVQHPARACAHSGHQSATAVALG